MSDTTAALRRKIDSARDLQSVVRTMKALAAASIGQYEKSVRALGEYSLTVDLGLGACFRIREPMVTRTKPGTRSAAVATAAVVFGSDQGLVGRFNDVVAEHATTTVAEFAAKPRLWAVGERIHARLADAGFSPVRYFAVPSSVNAIVPLIGQILVAIEKENDEDQAAQLLLFHNRCISVATYVPVCLRLLPLDEQWRSEMTHRSWPTKSPAEVMGSGDATLRALIQEYLFISIFRACAESLASENASRLAAMERADSNIDELLGSLQASFHRLRQSGIDEELFDVISGYEALSTRQHGSSV